MPDRKKVSRDVTTTVLTESGYRCAVPTCRNILAIDLHHMEKVSEGGSNDANNLLPLCPTCHALFHRGVISRESIYTWKAGLVAINRAFDVEAVDNLLFLKKLPSASPSFEFAVSGDGVLRFARLIAADLVRFKLLVRNGPLFTYQVFLSEKGHLLINAWQRGNRQAFYQALSSEQVSS